MSATKVADEAVKTVSASAPGSLAPRFNQEEKQILYNLFLQHQEVIDIKFRKKQGNKHSIRNTWQQIVNDFNSTPGIAAVRNLKQIQKFWLNVRLRKKFPDGEQKRNDSSRALRSGNQCNIKVEPEIRAEDNEVDDSVEEMDVNDSLEEHSVDGNYKPTQQNQEDEQKQAPSVTIPATIQAQQISVDQINTEKLSFNDLLQFKAARPREDIIFQIKQPTDATEYIAGTQITLPSSTRISVPSAAHHSEQQHTMATITANGYNQQIIGEIKPQQITLAQYHQAQQQHHQFIQQQQQIVVASPSQQQVKMELQAQATGAQQFATATPPFTCTTFNATPTSVLTANAAQLQLHPATTITSVNNGTIDNYDEKMNYFKLKEAELRCKEQQVALEKRKLELNRAQENFKNLQELHRLQMEEKRIQISILEEEEKQLLRNKT